MTENYFTQKDVDRMQISAVKTLLAEGRIWEKLEGEPATFRCVFCRCLNHEPHKLDCVAKDVK